MEMKKRSAPSVLQKGLSKLEHQASDSMEKAFTGARIGIPEIGGKYFAGTISNIEMVSSDDDWAMTFDGCDDSITIPDGSLLSATNASIEIPAHISMTVDNQYIANSGPTAVTYIRAVDGTWVQSNTEVTIQKRETAVGTRWAINTNDRQGRPLYDTFLDAAIEMARILAPETLDE